MTDIILNIIGTTAAVSLFASITHAFAAMLVHVCADHTDTERVGKIVDRLAGRAWTLVRVFVVLGASGLFVHQLQTALTVM